MTISYIWRATNGNLTRAGAAAANIIQFNEGAVTQNGYIFKSEFNVRISVPENERIDGDINAVQDMGMDGVEVIITGMIEKAAGDDESKIDYLMTWLKEAKVDSTFPFGKFGLELPDFPAFNCQPLNTGSAQYGYVLAGVRFVRDGDEVDKVGVIINLRYAGDKSGLGTP
jgi:hypothetical protein